MSEFAVIAVSWIVITSFIGSWLIGYHAVRIVAERVWPWLEEVLVFAIGWAWGILLSIRRTRDFEDGLSRVALPPKATRPSGIRQTPDPLSTADPAIEAGPQSISFPREEHE